MKATEYQTTSTRVVPMATGTPLSGPHTTGYPYGSAAPRAAGPSHNRVAIVGATGVALLLLAMGGIAYFKAQDAVVPVVVAPVTMTVPHAAAAELADSMADAAMLEGTAGVVAAPQGVATVSVPHAATAELADSLADVAPVTVLVPHGAVPVE